MPAGGTALAVLEEDPENDKTPKSPGPLRLNTQAEPPAPGPVSASTNAPNTPVTTRKPSVAFASPTTPVSARKPSVVQSSPTTARKPSLIHSSPTTPASERRPSVIHDIVIPPHLFTIDNPSVRFGSEDGTRRRASRTPRKDSRAKFDVHRIALDQGLEVQAALKGRSSSISVGAIGRRASRQGSASSGTRERNASLTPKWPTPFTLGGPKTEKTELVDPFAPARLRKPSDTPSWLSGSSTASPTRKGSNAGEPPSPSAPKKALLKKSARFTDATRKPSLSGLPDEKATSGVPFGDFTFETGGDQTISRASSQDIDPALRRTGSVEADPLQVLHAPRQEAVLLPATTGWRHGTMTGRRDTMTGRRDTMTGRRGTMGERRGTIVGRAASVVATTFQNATNKVRRSTMWDVYEQAKERGAELQRTHFMMIAFETAFYVILLAFIYFVLIGLPLWKGTVYWLYRLIKDRFVVQGTWAVTIGIAFLYAYLPLLIFFEPDPPMPEDLTNIDTTKTPGAHDTALMIPCYKSANLIGATLEAALKVFPPSHIYVIANGNSPTPLDNTEEVCRPYGVNHIWSPVGSKIVAQFVGCFAARQFKNVLLIDDDCALPPNFPIVSDRMVGNVKCVGYTIKSVGPESSRGTFAQQAQDLEYKLSGIQRAFAGKVGSATFPHGAISLWDTEFLISTFYEHPGFSVSEDWFFGHVARELGSRIVMCTSVFIETETPDAIFLSSGGARGGFGEMTIFKQRFLRWNFFFVNGMYYNMAYIFGSWKLGWYELGAKLFVFQEVYETLLYLLTPFVLPISFIVRPAFCGYLFAGVFGLYFLNAMLFNEFHLRRKKEQVHWVAVYVYYPLYKVILTFVNVGSCYWSLYKYAKYFAKRHPKIIEDEKAVNVVLRMEESDQVDGKAVNGRRMTVAAIGAALDATIVEEDEEVGPTERRMTVTTMGPRMGSSVAIGPAIGPGGRRMTLTVVSDKERPQLSLKTDLGPISDVDKSPLSPTQSVTQAIATRDFADISGGRRGSTRPPQSGRRHTPPDVSGGRRGSTRPPFESSSLEVSGGRRGSTRPSFGLPWIGSPSGSRKSSASSPRRKSTSGRNMLVLPSPGGRRPSDRSLVPSIEEEDEPTMDDELMTRLKQIEQRLNVNNIHAVDFAIEELPEEADLPPPMAPRSRQPSSVMSSALQMVEEEHEHPSPGQEIPMQNLESEDDSKGESSDAKDEVAEEDPRKTNDSRSMV